MDDVDFLKMRIFRLHHEQQPITIIFQYQLVSGSCVCSRLGLEVVVKGKWIMILTVIASIPLVWGFLPERERNPDPPKRVLPVVLQTEVDFGEMEPGDTVERNITIQNDTVEAWNLREISKPCSCLSFSSGRTAISVGGKADFIVAYRAGQGNGIDRKRAFIYFREGAAPVVEVLAIARIQSKLSCDQDSVEIEPGAEPQSREVVLTLTDSQRSARPSVGGVPDWLSCDIDEAEPNSTHSVAPESQVWKLRLRLERSKLNSVTFPCLAELKIETVGTKTRQCLIPVILRDRKRLVVTPDRVLLDADKPEKEARVLIGSELKSGVRVADLELSTVPSYLEAKLVQLDSKVALSVRLASPGPPRAKLPREGELAIREIVGDVRLPVRFYITGHRD